MGTVIIKSSMRRAIIIPFVGLGVAVRARPSGSEPLLLGIAMM
jgi:hypothetical protein